MRSPLNSAVAAIRVRRALAFPARPSPSSARSSPPSNAHLIRTNRARPPMQEFSPFDGALVIDKPSGPTSHDVVDAIRRHFGIKKVGHCGTLDPNATGLLVIVLGRGTKLS